MNGVLVVDKPRGWTSHDVVQKVRGLLKEKKIGHTGTLDPLATGVLVLCAGKATKIIRYLENDEKIYTAEMVLGSTTDTLDAEGRIVEKRAYTAPTRQQVQEVLMRFRGTILQRPPAYSALKVGGVPSHRLARAGKIITHEERPITIWELDLLEYTDPVIRIRVRCSKGTYIRTLCADIGQHLGMGAHLTSLLRNSVGHFALGSAHSIAEVTAAGTRSGLLVSMRDALGAFPETLVSASDARRLGEGGTVVLPPESSIPDGVTHVRVSESSTGLVAVARVEEGTLRPETVLL